MERKDIVKELEGMGYDAEEITVTKNRVRMDGIRIIDGSIAPIIYTDGILKQADRDGMTADEAACMVIRIMDQNAKPDINLDTLKDPDFIKSHVYIGMQRATDEDIVKKPWSVDDCIEMYLYIELTKGATAKVKAGMIDIDLDELWEAAADNTFDQTDIFNFAEYIGLSDDCPLWVCGNKSRNKGASAILDRRALRIFGERHGCERVYALPSSVHEWIILPDDKMAGIDIEALTEMVMMVNGSEVDPVEQLGDRAYLLAV